ncbi:MAG: isoaspartyl peptidase/L-asparaginase [Alphaproteobacteria bacterium]|nr:isoaspartyl peptidase/L-asparaginase [Alphaproteobacteria bacterium]
MTSFALAIHGGAGRTPRARLVEPMRAVYDSALAASLLAGRDVLAAGGTAVDAVCACVVALEDAEPFNAGHGAALCADATVALDASLMDGRDRSAGAVAGLARTTNPVLAARALAGSAHWFLRGADGDRFAEAAGLAVTAPEYFVTADRQKQLAAYQAGAITGLDRMTDDASGPDWEAADLEAPSGTVGAVARDRDGHLAAATSTGGVVNQPPGRVGDTPVIGAGTWADDGVCAISATGTGEAFMRIAFARRIADRMELAGETPQIAAADALAEVAALGGEGGCIVVDKSGRMALPFNTPEMFRGWVAHDRGPRIAIGLAEAIAI